MKKYKNIGFASLFALVAGYALVSADVTSPSVSLDGNYKTWTPNSGTTHYTQVDEATCNGNTDYVSTSVVGNRDSYVVSLAGIPDGSLITQVSITPCASKNAAGGSNSTMNVFYRANGVNSADAGAYSLSATTPADLATTNFSGLSITKGSTTTLEIGAVHTAGTKGTRLSRMGVSITYSIVVNAPTSLTATATLTKVDLSWVDNSNNESTFLIERTLTSTSSWSTIGTTTANTTTFSDNSVATNTSYTYRVRAQSGSTFSNYSNTAVVTTPFEINAPSSLTATASTSKMLLAWVDNSSNEATFLVERTLLSFISWSTVGTTTANTTTFSDNSVATSTLYAYRVRAQSGSTFSNYSNTVVATSSPQ